MSRSTTVEVAADPRADRPLPGTSPVVAFARRNRLLLAIPLATMVLGIVIAFARSTRYTSNASFLPATSSRSSPLSSLGAQFGITLPAADAAQSPAFYVDLLTSETVLRQVLRRPYQVSSDVPAKPLSQILEISESTPARTEDATVRKLHSLISTSANAKTGVVRVKVEAPSPLLAYQLTSELLSAIDRFNNERRKTGARAERQFAEKRLQEINGELAVAEEQLLAFRAHNRDLRSDSPARLVESQLQRKVGLLTQIQATVSQSYEQSQMDEVRDTPLISVIEAPTVPSRPDSRGTTRLGLTGLFLGLLLALAWGLSADAVRSPRQEMGR